MPIELDTWTGEITPIADYTRTGDRVTVGLQLDRDATTVIALTTDPAAYGVTAPATHVTSTNAAGVVAQGSDVYLEATSGGQYVTRLDGVSAPVVSTVGSVPAAIDLTDATWDLDVEDWKPAQAYGTVGVAGSETSKDVVSVSVDGLAPWSDIAGIESASGVGTYTTTLTLPSDWKAATHGATIDLGQVTDTFRLSVNGQAVGIDQVSGQADIGSALKAGTNTLDVRVATTLNNRMFQLETAVANRGLTQENGLVGPVTVTPYRLVKVEEPAPVTPGTKALRVKVRPRLTGKHRVGQQLKATHGTWTPAATSYAYTWKRNGQVIRSAHRATYRLTRADLGKRIKVIVTATRAGYTSATATTQVVRITKKK